MAVNPATKRKMAGQVLAGGKPVEDDPRIMCKVIDKNCNNEYPVRTHEMGGKKWKLTNDLDTTSQVPYPLAVNFLKDRSFEVYDPAGNRLEVTLPSEGASGMRLGPTQCVAFFNELTKEALIARCIRLPGGQVFTATSTKEKMIEFLVSTQANVQHRTVEPVEGDTAETTGADPSGDLEIEDDDESGEGTARIFENAGERLEMPPATRTQVQSAALSNISPDLPNLG